MSRAFMPNNPVELSIFVAVGNNLTRPTGGNNMKNRGVSLVTWG